ncbi:MAG: efflux RND transporter periplasmic adaptor subunit, partial [bacterium]|nr:efflux RND transporter periplasmic adaptor subunit [bacterium]
MTSVAKQVAFSRNMLIGVIVLLLTIAAAIYWFRFSPVAVVTHVVEEDVIQPEVLGTGTLEARVSATISPKVSGRIAGVLVDQGDRVTAGQLLVQLDDEELQQQVAIAEANVQAAVAALERIKTDKSRANVVLTQAQKNFDRVDELRKREATSESDLDQAAEALGIAVADVARAEAGINEGQKELIAAQKTLEYHRARLRDTQITAPFDGMVVARDREPGDVVVPGSSMLTLISTDELWVSAWVDETEMGKLEQGQSARVVFRSQPELSLPGTVSRLGRQADRETREFIVDVRVLELPKNWAVGQRAEAFIGVAEAVESVVLPREFLVRRQERDGVFILHGGSVKWQAVQLGVSSRERIQVLEGL